MLFLLNEVVLDLNHLSASPWTVSRRFARLSFDGLVRLGQELYAEQPLLHRVRPDRACRLASLIAGRAPHINAALFVATRYGAAAEEVSVQFASLSAETMNALDRRQETGELNALAADRQVWRRLAA